MRSYKIFQKAGKVSVWIGAFSSEAELDDYLNISRKFETDFNFEINERDMPESLVMDGDVKFSEMVDRFSWSRSYRDEVLGVARESGMEGVNAMVVFFNCSYFSDAQADAEVASPLRFLCVASFK